MQNKNYEADAWGDLGSVNFTPAEPVIDHAAEKEIMMLAFQKVRQLFESRSWIMEGRGSYPYNDERYKEEVRYLYDEFDTFQKDTWDNIVSKSGDFRKEVERSLKIDFQLKVNEWMQVCFGEKISNDVPERNHRFLEEALELVQSTGATKEECHMLVDYVFNRPIGEINQEIGGVMVTLSALCTAVNEKMIAAGEKEVERIWTKIDAIRKKQATKPHSSPLPGTY